MDFTPRYPIRSNSESSNTIHTNSPEHQSDFKSHWSNKMYSTQNLNNSSKQHLLGGTTNENRKNYNLSKMYSTKQSLSMENMTNHPKKETFWQSAFKSATNLLNEHLNRSTGSIIKSWSSMNHPLSVTVVAPDLLKSLQQAKNHQLVNPSEGIFATKTWNKDSQSIDETLPNILYSNEFISDSAKKNSDPSDSDRRWKEYKNLYVDFTETQKKDLNKDEKIVNSVNNSDCNLEALESHFNFVVNKKDVDRSTNFSNTMNVDDDPVILEKPDTLPLEVQQELQEKQQQQQNQPHMKAASLPMPVGMLLTNAYNKVISGVTDLLQNCSSSQETCEPTSLFTKRACTSSKPRSKRMHTVSVGRGRGRGKSQLRRSGVSQTRHRKERSRYNNSEDIKSDIDNWEALDYNPDDETFEDVDVCDFASKQPGDDESGSSSHQYKNGSTFTLGDVKPKKKKPKKNQKCSWEQRSVACSVQSLDENGEIESSFDDKIESRPRLSSESSIDSEDSYCIVFEDDGSSKTSDSESDYEDHDCETDTDAETRRESEEEEESDSAMPVQDIERRPTKQVHFDEKPKIHLMVKWKYAYKAARRGHWEELGRDLDRFRIRIQREGRTIEPVLRNEHRMRIWRERFEDKN